MDKSLIKAVNLRNRTKINEEFKKIYNEYYLLAFYNSFRIVGDKDDADKIANEAFLIIFKNIYDCNDLKEEISYLATEMSLKKIDTIDDINSIYSDILTKNDITDDDLYYYINVYLYKRKYKDIKGYKEVSKKIFKRKLDLSILNIGDYDILELLQINIDYEAISSKIEMPSHTFFIKEVKFLYGGISLVIISVILFIIAIINACIPKSNSSISTYLFYVCMVLFALGAISLLISASINKYNKNKWK